MTEQAAALTREWTKRFGEPPALVDEDLMRALLAEDREANREARS